MRTDYILEGQLQLILAGLTADNRLVFQIMLRTGLRVGDVLELRKDQLARQFWVTEQKTGKRRRVGLTDDLIAQIKRRAGRSEWAFPSPTVRGAHRTRQAVWSDLKRVQRALRLPVNVGTHSARKVYAVYLRDKYGDIESVQRALNHDNPSVTMLYAMADLLVDSAAERRVQMRRVRRR